jgi:hypothetical protein
VSEAARPADVKSADAVIEGGCLCGAIRYRIDGPATPAVHCHCSMCRRSAGAVFVTWITVAAADLRFVRGQPRLYVSSSRGERQFCGDCGAQLTWSSRPAADTVDVTVGTLDHPERHPADRHSFADDRISWLRFDDTLDVYGGEGP